MEENQNVNKGQTTADAGTDAGAVSGGSANPGTANEQHGEAVNQSAFSDPQKETKPDNGTAKEDKQGSQTKEQNAENARRRREAERQKEMREMREKTIIDALNGTNPYTGEPMTDSVDVEEFETMREIEKNGGDPVQDYPKYRKQKERESIAKRAEDGKTAEWYKKDGESFRAEYPDVNLDELHSNPDFVDYAEGKIGSRPLSEIYKGYLKQEERIEKRAKDLAAQYIANQKASPGALHDTKAPDADFFTEEQVRRMSRSEVAKNYEKIQKSMKKW